jgi:membrane-bound ClpP family serine protease
MRKLLIVAMLMLLISTSYAANIYTEPGSVFAPDAINIYIVGEIQPDDDKTFASLAEKIPDGRAVVYLSSPGGNMISAMNIGLAVHHKQFTTVLSRRTQECASACTHILLAGAHVYVERGALLVFHRPSVNGQESMEGTQLAMQYLSSIGLTDKQIGYMLSAPPQGALVAMPGDAWALGFDPQVIFCPLGLCNWHNCQKRWCYVMP